MFINIVGTDSFNEKVLFSKGMVFVNFWAWWSDECNKMSSLMRKIKNILDEQDTIVQIDWDQQKQLANDLDVFGVPSLLIYNKGIEIDRYSGVMNKDELIKRILKAKDSLSKEGGMG